MNENQTRSFVFTFLIKGKENAKGMGSDVKEVAASNSTQICRKVVFEGSYLTF